MTKRHYIYLSRCLLGCTFFRFLGDSSELRCASLLCTIFASLARAEGRVHIHSIYKMVAFSKRLRLRETSHRFFLGNEYRDLTIFLFSLNTEITFFLHSEYGPIFIAE